MKKIGLLLTSTAFALSALTDAGRAEACGGCFSPPNPPPDQVSLVTDHRMAFSISPQQTILWDQIRYSGDPHEFAWVLPVHAGAKIELANDEFFTALDASTAPVIYPPPNSNSIGCALTGCSDDGDSAFASEKAGGDNGVTVVSQSVVGPYEQATLRATDNGALVNWLRTNNYDIPSGIIPTISAYVAEGFDFIALKLRPECGQKSMQPVRVVSPGAIPTLPLRMVAAGVGANVGIILYVITEGRYQTQNFPHAVFDDAKLRWSYAVNKSNYEPLALDLMRQANGTTWLVEYADKPQIPFVGKGWQQPQISNGYRGTTGDTRKAQTGLANTYYSLCPAYTGPRTVSSSSSSSSSSGYNPYYPYGTSASSSSSGGIGVVPCPETKADAGVGDAGGGLDSGFDAGFDAGDDTDAGEDDDAGPDGGTRDGGEQEDPGQTSSSSSSSSGGYTPAPRVDPSIACQYLDDLDAALDGLNRDNVWVTRLRSVLPSNALAADLVVEPAKTPDGRADTTPVSNLHWTPYQDTDNVPDEDVKSSCAGVPRRTKPYASWASLAICGIAVAASVVRRRRRPR